MDPISSYFVWDADPILVHLGTLHLPFTISIYGLVAAVILYIFGANRLEKQARQKTHGRQEAVEPDPLKMWALVIGSFIIGQLIFLIIPSPGFSQIGPVEIRWYGLLFASAFVTGYFIEKKLFLDSGRTVEELERLLTYVLIATVIGARLGHVIFYDLGYYLNNPGEIIAIWHGGLASHGAAIGILLAMWLYVQKKPKMSFLWLADRVVIPVAIGGAFIRTGNFFNSEIIGRPTDLPWAVVFQRVDMLPRHPSMLYEALLSVLVFALLWVIYKKYAPNPPEGLIFGVFLITLFTGRFLIEFTKVRQAAFAGNWEFSMGQILSVPLVLAGIWIIWKKTDWSKPTTSES